MTDKEAEIAAIIDENAARNAHRAEAFNPITGYGSVGERTYVQISDLPTPNLWLPTPMVDVPLVSQLVKAGSVRDFLHNIGSNPEDYKTDRAKVIMQLVRVRCKYDFPFWAATFATIKNKGGGDDVLFTLTQPQRKLVAVLEKMRTANQPIRLVLLKARQWGASTTTQLYMAWLQLVHKVGLNSLIIAHVKSTSDEIKDMFDRMIQAYPVELLHQLGEAYETNEPKLIGVGRSGSIHRIPQRNFKIKVGTAQQPDGCRGGDYSLVHLSEVGLWTTTEGKRPEDIVRSACSGVLPKPYTMIVYESTANGTGNFFQREYDDAKNGRSNFQPLFVPWYEIEQYSLAPTNITAFAETLYNNRHAEHQTDTRSESGKYLWSLWQAGATLEAINWYIQERKSRTDHGQMASEYPSDDIEAFVHSGARVFDRYKVEALRPSCKPPRHTGEITAKGDSGKDALRNLQFLPDTQGNLHIWNKPEIDDNEKIYNRYLVVVDIGGRSQKADYSVILVIDRLFMMEGEKPQVVAQWYGHTDIDILAWKAVQIATYYDNALLVIESNTLETHDRQRNVEGDQSDYILNQIKDLYDNLYARKQSEADIREGLPRKYGFHTNISTKPMIISTLVKVLREGLYVERDTRCLDEYLCYERKANGAYGAIIGKHDDLLMTRAIGLHICFNEMENPRIGTRKFHTTPRRKTTLTAATL